MEALDIKQEIPDYPLEEPVKIKQERGELLTQGTVVIRSEINLSPAPLHNIKIKTELHSDELIDCINANVEEHSEVKPEDFFVQTNDLLKIEQEICYENQSLNKQEVYTSNITTEFTVKNEPDQIVQPGCSRQSLGKLKSKKKLKNKKSACPVCRKSFSSSLSRKHFNNHFGKRLVLCFFCGEMFVDRAQFLNHFFVHIVRKKRYKTKIQQGNYVGGSLYSCGTCTAEFASLPNLNKHLETHGPPKLNQCNICFKHFTRKTNLNKHLLLHDTTVKFQCNICYKTFFALQSLTSHMIFHKEEPFECQVCFEKFTQFPSLNKHIKAHHGDEALMHCPICLRKFKLAYNLKRHMFTHSDTKPYNCEICSKGFIDKRSYDYHINVHSGIKPFSCDICGRGFRKTANLQRHKITHNATKPLKCDICSVTFITARNLKFHHERKHTERVIIKSHQCDTCPKSFEFKSELTLHMASHAIIKPFSCKLCFRDFARFSSLNRHMIGHSNGKFFKCDVCSRQFAFKKDLKKHKCAI